MQLSQYFFFWLSSLWSDSNTFAVRSKHAIESIFAENLFLRRNTLHTQRIETKNLNGRSCESVHRDRVFYIFRALTMELSIFVAVFTLKATCRWRCLLIHFEMVPISRSLSQISLSRVRSPMKYVQQGFLIDSVSQSKLFHYRIFVLQLKETENQFR